MSQQQLFLENFPDRQLQKSERALERERLPTSATMDHHGFHRWHSFIAGFSPEFVQMAFSKLDERMRRGILLDPFAGCGTAPLTAALSGMRAVGYEAHPLFAAICRAKIPTSTHKARLASIVDIAVEGFRDGFDIRTLPEKPREFLTKLFTPATLSSLLGARVALERAGLAADPLAILILSRVLERCSHSATDGIYKAPTTRKVAALPAAALNRVRLLIEEDLHGFFGPLPPAQHEIHQKSSVCMTELEPESVSIVVTSPPYLNNFDYAEMTRMHLYFWGWAESWGEISAKVRSQLIVNTTTALKGHKEIQAEYRQQVHSSLRKELDELVESLREKRRLRAGKKEYDLLVFPYFAQMMSVLRECRRALMPDAPIHIVVADAALYGTHISTPQILAKVLTHIGFQDVRCELMRSRGHRWVLAKREGSTKGLGEYHVHARRS